MYTIGEFSRVAQVSKRLLRYYDEIGLLKPLKVDRFTGYRYYSVSQLSVLNRILALKELGLSLEQIQRFMADDISLDEIQGMLSMQKIELEQQLMEGLQRIRVIESRLQQIREQQNHMRDVVIKQVPRQLLLGMRRTYADYEEVGRMFEAMIRALPIPNNDTYAHFMAVIHADGLDDAARIDMESGRLLKGNHDPLILNEDITLNVRELPAVETMATFIQHGISAEAHLGFSAIGTWMEANDYRFAGPVREILLEIPDEHTGDGDSVFEIQFPVEKQQGPLNLLTDIIS